MLTDLQSAIKNKKYRITGHARSEMINDGLSQKEVISSVLSGEIIREYPEDKPFASVLVLGKSEKHTIHSVWAMDMITGMAILIPVYIPDPLVWDFEFRRKL